MANLADLVMDSEDGGKKVKTATAPKGRKRYWQNGDNDEATEKVKIEDKKEDGDSSSHLEKVKKEYEDRILKLEKSIAKLSKREQEKFSKNEEKLLNAIRLEMVKQKTSEPFISTNKLRKIYKVHPAYFSKALVRLRGKGCIEREVATYSGQVKTYKYRIVSEIDVS